MEGPLGDPTPNDKSGADLTGSSSDGESSDREYECEYLRVRSKQRVTPATNEDQLLHCQTQLAAELRDRPTLPASEVNDQVSFADVESWVRLAVFACPFKGCRFHTNKRREYVEHLSCKNGEGSHWNLIKAAYEKHPDWRKLRDIPFELVNAAVSVTERRNFPRIGPAVTRRTLNRLMQRYNDKLVSANACFICGQLRLIVPDAHDDVPANNVVSEISYYNMSWLRSLAPGALMNNCGFDLWKSRFANERSAPPALIERRMPRRDASDPAYALSEWCIDVETPVDQVDACGLAPPFSDEEYAKDPCPTESQRTLRLIGITEDIRCEREEHHDRSRDCRKLCQKCLVPICKDCHRGLLKYKGVRPGGGVPLATIPMAIANDNYYGYVERELVKHQATWLECAASSLVWSTIMVYYLEDPHGHLMLERMGQAQARTQARGNLFSSQMPWEDIEKCCADAGAQTEIKLPRRRYARYARSCSYRRREQRFGGASARSDDATECRA